jgi:hypothetical protein
MDFEIREVVVGHRTGMTMAERYGRIGDDDLVNAIDSMTSDHGKTEILVGRATRIHEDHEQNTNKNEGPPLFPFPHKPLTTRDVSADIRGTASRTSKRRHTHLASASPLVHY